MAVDQNAFSDADMSASRRPVERPVSAGGVVYRKENGAGEVVLCGRLTPPMWSLPKGTPDPGETLEETALREVREETGLDVRLMTGLGSINYWFVRPDNGVRCHKTVHFYLMAPTGGSLDRHDPEFDLVRWFPAEEAAQAMAYADEIRMVEKALDLVDQRSAGHG